MLPTHHRQVLLAVRPNGIPRAEQFKIVETPLPAIHPGEFLVRNEFLSVEPAMRGWVNAAANYSDPVPVGDVMRSFAAGTVVASHHPRFAEGERVMGMLGWQEYSISDGRNIRRKVIETDLPLSLSLGVLGINGITAYFSLTEIARPRPQDTLVVSTAAGAVGSAVGQLAGLSGCRTVGIAGGAVKVRECLNEFAFDTAVDYKADDFLEALADATPTGVDIYHDNTAGRVSDAVLQRINKNARIVICGTASIPNWDVWPEGPRVERHLLNKSARMEGFLVWDYEHRYEEAIVRLASWVRSGRLRYREHILSGIEAAPGAIDMLYRGLNTGKLLIRLET